VSDADPALIFIEEATMASLLNRRDARVLRDGYRIACFCHCMSECAVAYLYNEGAHKDKR
jgi:hypothetical protein